MGFVKSFKDKINEHFVSNDYEEYESAISDDDFEDGSSDDNEASIYDAEPEVKNTFNSQQGISVPEYAFEPKSVAKKKVETPQPVAKSGQNANIYNFNSRPTNKFKLNSILLRDIYDAKNVAALMMEKDTIVVVNLSCLSDEQKVRAMDFLDGAKFVTKSVFVRFAESICAFVPESVELFGDFFSQVDLDSFNK
ncbi:MAG: cell division protein SepF [Clostridia bacterium]|nr:cell division protein SepF [Clostridia bacterium]